MRQMAVRRKARWLGAADSTQKTLARSGLFLFLFLASCTTVFLQISKEDASQNEDQAERLSHEWSGDSYRRSTVLYVKTAEQWRKLGELEKSSSCLRKASRLHFILTEYETADDLLKTAIAIDNKNNLLNEKILAVSLRSLVALRAGKVKESEKYYKQAIQLSSLAQDPLPIAAAFYSAGEHNYSYGDAEETIGLFEKALSNAEMSGEKDLLAQIRLYLGFTLVRKGDPVSGLRETTAALSIWQENGDKRGQAISGVGTGFVYSVMDEKQKALQFYQKAITSFPQDIDWIEKAKASNGIATIYEEYGEPGLAENYRNEALTLYQKANYLYGQLATLPSLAKLSYLKGNKALAAELDNRGLILANKLHDIFHIAIIKEDLGDMALDDGAYDKAIRNYSEAALIYDRIKIKLPRVQGLLAKAFEKKGDIRLARQYYQSSLRTNHEIKDKFAEAQVLYDLARLDKIEEKDENALKLIGESISISESFSSDVLNSKLKSTYFSSIYNRYELYIELLMRTGKKLQDERYQIQALQASERARARSMLETLRLSESNFIRDANPDIIRREKEIRTTLNLKADMLTDALSGGSESDAENLSNELNRLYNELEQIKASLKQDSPIYSAIKDPAPFNIAAFQNSILDDSTVVLEFFLGKDESYLWLVGKNEVGSYVLPSKERIETRVQRLRELLDLRGVKKGESAEEYQVRLTAAEDAYRQEARVLSNELLEQLGDKLIGKRLIIVPDGKLHYFPISALPRPNSDSDDPILLTNEIIYESSASTIFLLMMDQKKLSAVSKDLLVFSDPIFSDVDSRLSQENANWTNADSVPSSTENFRFVESLKSLPRLVASKIEGDSVAKIIGISNSTVFTGFSATRDQVLSPEISNYKIIHFATHSLINEQRPELSGIVLSRYDENGQRRNEFVRLQDIYGMDLSADLVVLSACDTGIGKDVKGEGLISLTNGFIQVGAKSVVSTLWKVDDDATLELMKNFYTALAKGGLTPSQALRDAQIKMRQSRLYNSPFYWAAFNLQGDFRRTPNFSSGFPKFGYLVIISSVVLLLLFGGYRFYRYKKTRRTI